VHHGLSDEIPIQTDIALPRRTRPPAGFEHVAWHVFAPETFGLARDELTVANINVGIFSPERTIVDVFRLGHLEGVDVAHKALRRWLRKQGSNPSSLLQVARSFPTALPHIQHALEVLL
jgi:predicted transcriptional regulator of viral defense system